IWRNAKRRMALLGVSGKGNQAPSMHAKMPRLVDRDAPSAGSTVRRGAQRARRGPRTIAAEAKNCGQTGGGVAGFPPAPHCRADCLRSTRIARFPLFRSGYGFWQRGFRYSSEQVPAAGRLGENALRILKQQIALVDQALRRLPYLIEV